MKNLIAILALSLSPQDKPKVWTVTHTQASACMCGGCEDTAIYTTRHDVRWGTAGIELRNATRDDGTKLKRVIFLSGRLEVE